MVDCVFCAIVAGEEPAHRVYEDSHTLAFLDSAPATTGHALVVPKPHRETLTDVEGELVADVFRTVRRVAAALESAYDPDGVSVVQSNGVAAGQDVFHAHVHVVPRYEDDAVALDWSHEELPAETGRDVASAIRHEL